MKKWLQAFVVALGITLPVSLGQATTIHYPAGGHIIEDGVSGVLPQQPTLFCGSGVTCADDPANSQTTISQTAGAGADAPYVTHTTDASLTNERVITAGNTMDVTITAGDGQPVTINFDADIQFAKDHTTGSSTAGIQEAIDALPANGGLVILQCETTSTITAGITVTDDIRIMGCSGGGGGPAAGGGSLVQADHTASAFAMFTLAGDNIILQDFTIDVVAAQGTSIGVDINDGVNGANDWMLHNVTVRGSSAQGVGIGVRLIFALKGVIQGGEILRWGDAINVQSSGTNRSNANHIQGVKIRASDIGIHVPSTTVACRQFTVTGSTIEGNEIGIDLDADCNVRLLGNWFENNAGATPTNIQITDGSIMSIGNTYRTAAANRDIRRTAGTKTDFSLHDEFLDGISSTSKIVIQEPEGAIVNGCIGGGDVDLLVYDGSVYFRDADCDLVNDAGEDQVSLLGQTIEGGEITDGTILSADIFDGTITAADLGTGSVTWADEIADDLGCTGTQAVRRNAGDTAWECFSSAGDVTAVGPGCATGECLTDTVTTSGTTMFVWEGTASDANELSIISPTDNPLTDIDITLPSSTGTLLLESRTLTGGDGIDIAGGESADLSADRTLTVDTTELDTATFGANSDFTWTFDPAGASNPAIQFTNNTINVTTGNLQEGGSNVLTVADQDAGTDITTDLEEEAHASEHASASGIDAVGETLVFDAGEINDETWGDNSDATITHTFDPTGTTNPVWSYTDGVVELTTGDLQVDNQQDVRWLEGDAGGSNYVAFQGAATIAANVTWTLPNADGAANEVLTTDGAGVLSWSAGGAGDITDVGDCATGACFTADGTGNSILFEGTVANANEITLTAANPGADFTVTIPAETGTVCTTGTVCSGYEAETHGTEHDGTDGDFVTDSGDTMTGNLVMDAGAGDSPHIQFDPGTGTSWTIGVEDDNDNFEVNANTASAEVFEFSNIGSGDMDVKLVDGDLALGTLDPTAAIHIQGNTRVIFFDAATAGGAGEGISYESTGATSRLGFSFPGSNVTRVQNRGTNGQVELCGNTATGGSGGEVCVVTVEDDQWTATQRLTLQDVGNALIVQNTSDAVSVQTAVFRSGNRVTAADNDEGVISLNAQQNTGAFAEFCRMTWVATDVTSTTKDGAWELACMSNNTLTDLIRVEDTGSGIQIGRNNADVVTIDTDGTGNAELVVPDESISGTEMANDTVGPTQVDETASYTWTGTHDFSGGLIELTNQAGACVATDCDVAGEAGRICVNTSAATGRQTFVCEGASGWVEIAGTGGGGTEWTDTGTVLHPNETGDDVALGNTTLVNASKLSIDGDADQVQLTVQGFSTQTDSLFILETSGGTEVATIENSGLLFTAVGLDGIGAVDMDYGSADVTDHTFTADGTTDADFVVPNTSIGGAEIVNNTIDETQLAATITFAAADDIVLPIEAADQTTDGEIDYDTTEEVIEVGDDGVATLKFYPGTHAFKLYSWTGASTLPLQYNQAEADGIAAVTKDDTTNTEVLVASFDDTADECRGVQFYLPEDADGAGTVQFHAVWYSQTATTNDVIWYFCETNGGEGTTIDADCADQDAAADTVQGTAELPTITSWTATMTAMDWDPDEWVIGYICRDGDSTRTGLDNMTGDAELKLFAIEVPRA